jgi:ribosomal protein S18 acetylase RimI-like enzyme
MAFRYFAYGSNLWPPQLRSRCGSAVAIGPARLIGWRLVCDKPSADGSLKLNIRPDPASTVEGVIYRIDDGERQALDAAEPLYSPVVVDVDGRTALTYAFEGEPATGAPYDWYAATCALGASCHGIATDRGHVSSVPDPIAPGIRPATGDDLPFIQGILSAGLAAETDRYYVHPGDYAWWVFHDDPRHPDHFSTWIQDDSGFVTIDSLAPREINVFARPGVDRMPLIRWSQRRLGGRGEVGWVSDSDTELIEGLKSEGYSPSFSYRSYEWDLTGDIPESDLPTGWGIRPVLGEGEANTRRAAAHAAFESTMPDAMHLQRYLDFMRSPVYVPERDLVAVDPSGTVVSFMVWWSDPTSHTAQIEPFGTHPGFHRRGVGRALILRGLAGMKEAGMKMARVCTDDDRPATGFYEGVGFADVGRLRWWAPST